MNLLNVLSVLTDYATVIAIIVIIIVITFLLVIFLPKPKCYFDTKKICKELLLLNESHMENLKKELIPLLDNETYVHVYSDNTLAIDTKTISTSYDLFRSIPYVRNITLVKLDPKLDMNKSKGSSNLANHTIRCALALKCSGAQKSGIWVDGEMKFFTEAEWIIYDNSREHSIFNKHKRLHTYLLIIDIDRPDWLPLGISTEENDLII